MNPLAPQNVLFLIAIASSVLLMLINAIGGIDHSADGGHDVDHDADHDHSGDGLFGRAISILGIGRAPLMLVLLIFLGIFGTTGVFLNLLLGQWLPTLATGILTHALALLTAITGTNLLARRLGAAMPRTESYNVSKEDLVGCSGTAVYTISAASGAAQIRDRSGDVFKIQARTLKDETLPMGTEILVLSYDEPSQTFIVTALDVK